MATSNGQDFKIDNYFAGRSVDVDSYSNYTIPQYLVDNLPRSLDAKILDIGCGLGQMLKQLKQKKYSRLYGIDISTESIEACKKENLNVFAITDIIDYARTCDQKFDFITMSHVLEHIEKEKVIDTLKAIRQHLLNDGGTFMIMVPNAQSNTGCYWMYEDFTHYTLYTAGSLNYVLKAAGYKKIEFIDPYCLAGSSKLGSAIKKMLIRVYEIKISFWNWVTKSSYHSPSPKIYSFEIKVKVS